MDIHVFKFSWVLVFKTEQTDSVLALIGPKICMKEKNSCVAWQVNRGQKSGFTERQPKRKGKDRSLYNPYILSTLKNMKNTLRWFCQPRSCMLPGPPSGWGRDKQIMCYRNVDRRAVGFTAIHLWCAITKTSRSSLTQKIKKKKKVIPGYDGANKF